ncbi:MAG: TetR/AcrR family transcriptional regulator [Chloroflexi bacterium]|nr:TetR/AcrR family transcriptional regulator [Chloroflexota bacterium]
MLSTESEKLDPRVKRTRHMIEQAFMELVTEKGFQAVSVQDVTERAGINRATFYAHFPDKFALLDHAIRQDFHAEIEKRTLNVCHFSQDNLRNLIIAVCEFVANAHGHCAVSEQQFQALVESQVRSQIYGLLYHWLEKIPLIQNTPITREYAATSASWAIYGLATEWSRNKRQPPVEKYADEVFPLIAANLGLTIELA